MTQPFTSANCERMTNKLRTKTHQLQPKANITTAATATEAATATAAATAHTTNASIVCGRECVELVCHPSARAVKVNYGQPVGQHTVVNSTADNDDDDNDVVEVDCGVC